MDPALFSCAALRKSPFGGPISRVLGAALQAVEPGAAVRRFLSRTGSQLHIGEQTYDLSTCRRIVIVGAGKAAYPMASAAVEILGGLVQGGLVITKDGHAPELTLPGGVLLRESSHPIPDQRGANAASEMEALLQQAGPDDLVICLISGGGSALMPAPAPGISLDDLQKTTALLLACGASINQINTLRTHLDRLKGGGLARCAAPARLAALVLSDVIGDPLDIIASGPSVPDPSSFQDALNILDNFALRGQVPASVRSRLEAGARGEIAETPKPGDPIFARVQTLVVSSNIQAARAAAAQAAREGFTPLILTTYLQGEARQAGRFIASLARQVEASAEPLARPACIIAGGETTVTLSGSGRGGRNQELALGAAQDLAGLPGVFLVTLATDGGDGPTDAAGAVVTGETAALAQQAGLSIQDFLARNDSYTFFARLDDLLRPGPTRTNVNDLCFLFLT
jgi:hydroxypyruvate reductase